MPDTLDKQPSEDRLYDMDFSPRLAVTELLNAIPTMIEETVDQDDGSVTSSTDLTFGTPTISGQIAQCRISGGLDGVLYKVTFQNAGTDFANLVEAEGFLLVQDI
jgi:hypothetical protein